MNEEKLIQYVTEVVEGILEKIATAERLDDDEKVTRLKNEITSLLNQLGLAFEQVIPQQVIVNYFGAVDQATKLLAAEGMNIAATVALTESGTVAKAFQKRIHLQAVEKMTDDTLSDLKAAIRTAKSSATATVDEVLESVRSEVTKGQIAGDPNKVIRNRLMKSFLEKGLTSFKTKDNKNLPVDYYSKLLVRTKLRESGVKGANNRYLENGVNLVKISEHGATCPVCSKYEGMVICIDGEVEGFKSVDDAGVDLPPYHPFCRHTTSPYVIEYKSNEEIQSEKDKWKKFNPDKDTRSAKEKKEYNKEQEIRRKANEEKKQFLRWQSLLGEDNYKTIGAFRRAKRSNSKRFQALQSKYRSLSIKNQDVS